MELLQSRKAELPPWSSPSWEANSYSASQYIPHLLWNPMIHYYINVTPPWFHILIQINPVHTLPTDLFRVHFNIVFPSMFGSFKCFFPFSNLMTNGNLVYAVDYMVNTIHVTLPVCLWGHLWKNNWAPDQMNIEEGFKSYNFTCCFL